MPYPPEKVLGIVKVLAVQFASFPLNHSLGLGEVLLYHGAVYFALPHQTWKRADLCKTAFAGLSSMLEGRMETASEARHS